ncbi:hypothetical protein [Aurantimonas coralicida]|uniref:hypothetical protein n=1 Tax=Aurantimonas coralicida TaxID=182270 RepID=UPI0004055378|nr:hypothetical protein [Aurantimonas coralicida]
MTTETKPLAEAEIASRLDAREIELVEEDIQHTFGKLGTISRANDPTGGVCGWFVANGHLFIPQKLLPVDGTLDTESECHSEHRWSMLLTLRSAYNAGKAA